MLGRLIFVAILLLGVLITSLELSANARARKEARRAASVADVVTGRGPDASLPSAPEADEAPPAASPTITY
ncbi:MAG TPA: hypothetical protein VGT02_19705 [Methylomirabilota bacterium]|jgi:hypothetical protein|nr:hypothetical protein [Methylomirabilota bacterium]